MAGKQERVQAVVLAAGDSSRFKPLSEGMHKSLVKVCGSELVRHAIQGAFGAGVSEAIIVHGPGEDGKFREALKGVTGKVSYVLQPEPKGMGDAVKHAGGAIKNRFLVFNADRYDSGKFARLMLEKSRKTGAQTVLLASPTSTPWKHGMLAFDARQKDKVLRVVEKPSKGTEPSDQKAVGIYLLPRDFMNYYARVKGGHYDFEDALTAYAQANDCRAVFSPEEVSSAKYAFELLGAAKTLTSGLSRSIPGKARISRNAVIEGKVHLGDGTVVHENAVVKGPVYIGRNCVIGNNALVRENSVLEDGVMIGMNTEVARSIVLEGTHVHSGFVGDSVIGRNCRIGANFIVANRRLDRQPVKFSVKGEQVDIGKTSLGCVVGHNTSIGINCSAMPGAIIGCGCVIGPGTEVKGSVESGSIVSTEKKLVVSRRG